MARGSWPQELGPISQTILAIHNANFVKIIFTIILILMI